jgi:signal transduction histidine kinase
VLAQTFNAMAARLQSWDADLRSAVAERTAELNDAVVRLDAAFEQVRRFNADASHELRTPLTIVRGEAEVALRSPRSAPEYQRVLHSILEETEHMGHIIDGLLTLARADSGELKLEARPISLHDLLADLYQQAQVLAREKGIHVTFDCAPSLQVYGDELRLRQLFLNLLDNAVKYTGPGGRVWLEAWAEEGQPMVQVRDTGIGVAPEDLPHLFDRFFRADRARRREGEPIGRPSGRLPVSGSGLGLSICKWIVDAHGGTISVESQPGGGTSFRVRLPAGEPQPALTA